MADCHSPRSATPNTNKPPQPVAQLIGDDSGKLKRNEGAPTPYTATPPGPLSPSSKYLSNKVAFRPNHKYEHTSLSPKGSQPHSYGNPVHNPAAFPVEFEDTDQEEATPLLMDTVHSSLSRLGGHEIHCHTHQSAQVTERLNETRSSAKKRLVIATLCCLLFASGEALAGWASGSYAIVSDAIHMISDFANLAFGVIAISIGSLPAKKSMNYGWIRAEVLGALASVMLIWIVAVFIFVESIARLRSMDFEIQGLPMMIAGACAFFFNIFLLYLLKGTGHGHSHGGHSHQSPSRQQRSSSGHVRFENEADEDTQQVSMNGSPDSNHIQESQESRSRFPFGQHINIQAATAHVIGDVAMSGGVFIVSCLIYWIPSWKILDPVCSLVLCFVVVYATVKVFWNTLIILMEACPRNIDFNLIVEDLTRLDGVKMVHEVRIWGLTTDKNVMTAHLAVDSNFDKEEILQSALKLIKVKHEIDMVTIQLENLKPDTMNNCQSCLSIP